MGEVLHVSLLQLLLEHCNFLNIDISQGSVATRLRCGGIFKYELVTNLPVSLPVKEFWKSVNIWGSYGQEFGVLFFLRHSVVSFHSHFKSCNLSSSSSSLLLILLGCFHSVFLWTDWRCNANVRQSNATASRLVYRFSQISLTFIFIHQAVVAT